MNPDFLESVFYHTSDDTPTLDVLISILTKNPNIKSLALLRNHFTYEHFKVLRDYLFQNPTIESVDMSFSSFSMPYTEKFVTLFSYLPYNTTIKHIFMHNICTVGCPIDSFSCISLDKIVEYFKYNSSVVGSNFYFARFSSHTHDNFKMQISPILTRNANNNSKRECVLFELLFNDTIIGGDQGCDE